MREYLHNGSTFAFDYPELKALYEKYMAMDNEEFMADLPNILHFATFICWFKREPGDVVLSDTGLIHELIHLMVWYYHTKKNPGPMRMDIVRTLLEKHCRLA